MSVSCTTNYGGSVVVKLWDIIASMFPNSQ